MLISCRFNSMENYLDNLYLKILRFIEHVMFYTVLNYKVYFRLLFRNFETYELGPKIFYRYLYGSRTNHKFEYNRLQIQGMSKKKRK